MRKRPLSVSIIAWILLIAGILSLITSLLTINNPNVKEMMENNPLPMSVQYTLIYAGMVILIACGIGMLKGKSWARILYVVWGVLNVGLNLATAPAWSKMMIPGVVFLIIVIFFLFRPKANAYFAGRE